MVREAVGRVEAVMAGVDAGRQLREAFAALQAGRFEAARDLAEPVRGRVEGALLYALGLAGAGDVTRGAWALHNLARSNPRARHPALDLADLLYAAGRGEDVAWHLRAALAQAPGHPALLAALGAALAEHGPVADALEVFARVAAARPHDADAQANWAKALAALGRFEEAEAVFARVPPGDRQRDLNRAVAQLKSGRLRDAWPQFSARNTLAGRGVRLPGTELRTLDGIAGRSVLLLHDEGFGDTLQFIRYAPELQRLGAHVRVVAPPPLQRLLCGQGFEVMGALPPGVEWWCRIPDLPELFGTEVSTIPAPLPYITPDPALVAHWAARLPPGRRIGLVWAGGARPGNTAAAATDRIRSIRPERLGPLLAAPGVTWVSLQKGHAPPPGVFDPMPGVADFADTAGIIAGLKMVVSVDTAVAHLAAAMGKRVLLLDRFDNCWRWLHGREDSPWYPGVLRIVRQDRPGDWEGVLRRAAEIVAAPEPWRA